MLIAHGTRKSFRSRGGTEVDEAPNKHVAPPEYSRHVRIL